jgi:hypothetical protein
MSKTRSVVIDGGGGPPHISLRRASECAHGSILETIGDA